MVKTSTPLHSVNLSEPATATDAVAPVRTEEDVFYEDIKPQLNQLVKEPSQETIDRILAYAVKK